MIKFRCSYCEQKIAVNDEGASAEILCPNCGRRLVVPMRSTPEFRQTLPVPVAESLVVLPPEGQALDPEDLRAALLPHLAERLTDRLVQELVSQRRMLLDTQTAATERMVEFEQRVGRLQALFEKSRAGYEARIEELERELAGLEAENRRRGNEKLRLAVTGLKSEPSPTIPA